MLGQDGDQTPRKGGGPDTGSQMPRRGRAQSPFLTHTAVEAHTGGPGSSQPAPGRCSPAVAAKWTWADKRGPTVRERPPGTRWTRGSGVGIAAEEAEESTRKRCPHPLHRRAASPPVSISGQGAGAVPWGPQWQTAGPRPAHASRVIWATPSGGPGSCSRPPQGAVSTSGASARSREPTTPPAMSPCLLATVSEPRSGQGALFQRGGLRGHKIARGSWDVSGTHSVDGLDKRS